MKETRSEPCGRGMVLETLRYAESDARRNQDYARVLELHRQLQSRYGDSREAHVSPALA